MFDLGASEILLAAIVAILIIGPKDLPLAMRTLGRWIAKWRNMTRHLRVGLDAIIQEAEMEENERKWAEQNKRIMEEHGGAYMESTATENTVNKKSASDNAQSDSDNPDNIQQTAQENALDNPMESMPIPPHSRFYKADEKQGIAAEPQKTGSANNASAKSDNGGKS